jgi:hypothetical protein
MSRLRSALGVGRRAAICLGVGTLLLGMRWPGWSIQDDVEGEYTLNPGETATLQFQVSMTSLRDQTSPWWVSFEPTSITETTDSNGETAIEVRCWMLQSPDTLSYGLDSTSWDGVDTGMEGWTECRVALQCKTDVPQSCSATIEVELTSTSSAPVQVAWIANAWLNGTRSGCSQCSADPDNSEASVTLELIE